MQKGVLCLFVVLGGFVFFSLFLFRGYFPAVLDVFRPLFPKRLVFKIRLFFLFCLLFLFSFCLPFQNSIFSLYFGSINPCQYAKRCFFSCFFLFWCFAFFSLFCSFFKLSKGYFPEVFWVGVFLFCSPKRIMFKILLFFLFRSFCLCFLLSSLSKFHLSSFCPPPLFGKHYLFLFLLSFYFYVFLC